MRPRSLPGGWGATWKYRGDRNRVHIRRKIIKQFVRSIFHSPPSASALDLPWQSSRPRRPGAVGLELLSRPVCAFVFAALPPSPKIKGGSGKTTSNILKLGRKNTPLSSLKPLYNPVKPRPRCNPVVTPLNHDLV